MLANDMTPLTPRHLLCKLHENFWHCSVSGDPSLATSFGVGGFRGDLKHRTIVCRHFLLGLCQNGYSCGYLHRLDKKKMPACKHGNLCKIKNCLLKHTDEQEISECIFYKQVWRLFLCILCSMDGSFRFHQQRRKPQIRYFPNAILGFLLQRAKLCQTTSKESSWWMSLRGTTRRDGTIGFSHHL
jgi:hypothetical protein